MEIRDCRDPQPNQFHLVELSPELEEAYKNGQLTIRGHGDGRVFLCTQNSTHIVKTLKQSNTLLVYKDGEPSINVFASPSEILESDKVAPSINWSLYPQFTSNRSILSTDESPKENEFCSPEEFKILARNAPLAYINGVSYRVHPDVVQSVLVLIVLSMLSNGDLELKSAIGSLNIDVNYPKEVIAAVYRMFQVGETQQMDFERVKNWLGLHVLSRQPLGLKRREWIEQWRADFPFNTEFHINDFKSQIVETKPDYFVYINKDILPTNPKDRLDKLFGFKPQWELGEMTPFLEPVVPHGKKIENWIIKFCKRQRVGKEYLISKR